MTIESGCSIWPADDICGGISGHLKTLSRLLRRLLLLGRISRGDRDTKDLNNTYMERED
jgi:hypothetical protein